MLVQMCELSVDINLYMFFCKYVFIFLCFADRASQYIYLGN